MNNYETGGVPPSRQVDRVNKCSECGELFVASSGTAHGCVSGFVRQTLSPLGDSHFTPYIDQTGGTVVFGAQIDF